MESAFLTAKMMKLYKKSNTFYIVLPFSFTLYVSDVKEITLYFF